MIALKLLFTCGQRPRAVFCNYSIKTALVNNTYIYLSRHRLHKGGSIFE